MLNSRALSLNSTKFYLFTTCFAITLLSGCGSSDSTTDSSNEKPSDNSSTANEVTITEHGEDSDYSWDSTQETLITLDNENTNASNNSVSIDGQQVTINNAGNYRLQGELNDGQILVETKDEAVVRLILDNASLTNTKSAAINIVNAERTIIIAPTDTLNSVTDASQYIYNGDTDEPDAAIFSDDDLTIYGHGTLIVNGNYNDAIIGKDGLLIKQANIQVNAAADDGIRGKDYLQILNSTISIKSTGDGLKSNNDEDTSLGYVSIDNSTITIDSSADAIQAETDVLISNNSLLNIITGGGSTATLADEDSAKGIKANGKLLLTSSSITLDCADDALHAGDLLQVTSSNFIIASGDDALHSDYDLTIDSGDITVTTSYEGIEAGTITINNGNIDITSLDDGINAASDEVTSPYLEVNNGHIAVNAQGDGIDVNGSMLINDGTVLVHGPTASNNGALDYDGSFTMNSGFLVAVGSSGMGQTVGSASAQNGVLINFDNAYSAGTLLNIQSDDGSELFTFKPIKSWQSVAFSSSALSIDSQWNIYTEGSHSGTEISGLYSNGEYNSGSLYNSFIQSSTITTIGDTSNPGRPGR